MANREQGGENRDKEKLLYLIFRLLFEQNVQPVFFRKIEVIKD
jgi:hypothetical protein